MQILWVCLQQNYAVRKLGYRSFRPVTQATGTRWQKFTNQLYSEWSPLQCSHVPASTYKNWLGQMRWVRARLTGCLVSQCTSWECCPWDTQGWKAICTCAVALECQQDIHDNSVCQLVTGQSFKLLSILAFPSVLVTLTSMGSVTADVWKWWVNKLGRHSSKMGAMGGLSVLNQSSKSFLWAHQVYSLTRH